MIVNLNHDSQNQILTETSMFSYRIIINIIFVSTSIVVAVCFLLFTFILLSHLQTFKPILVRAAKIDQAITQYIQ